MRKTVSEIARLVGGTLEGDPSLVITGVAGLREAQAGQLSFLAHPRYTGLLAATEAAALILGPDTAAPKGKTVIRVAQPNIAFGKIVELFAPERVPYPAGVHSRALVADGARLHPTVSVMPFAVIEAGAQIGARSVISAGCCIGREVVIGEDCLLYPNVVVRERCQIGQRVILHAGAVIGSDGFGYEFIEGRHRKIPQIGIVQVDDDVEIGANTTIDRARFGRTWIKRGVKIDNLVQIAHNVVIGENTAIAAQAGISGSAIIGKNVLIAGQVGTVGHIIVGDRAILLAKSGINHDVPGGQMVFGYPAQEHKEALKTHGMIRRLPHMLERIRQLEKKIGKKNTGGEKKGQGPDYY